MTQNVSKLCFAIKAEYKDINLVYVVHYDYLGKTNWRGSPSTVDLLVLSSLDQLFLKLKALFKYLLSY